MVAPSSGAEECPTSVTHIPAAETHSCSVHCRGSAQVHLLVQVPGAVNFVVVFLPEVLQRQCQRVCSVGDQKGSVVASVVEAEASQHEQLRPVLRPHSEQQAYPAGLQREMIALIAAGSEGDQYQERFDLAAAAAVAVVAVVIVDIAADQSWNSSESSLRLDAHQDAQPFHHQAH